MGRSGRRVDRIAGHTGDSPSAHLVGDHEGETERLVELPLLDNLPRRLGAIAIVAVAVCLSLPGAAAGRSAFDQNGMWIWYVNKSSGGSTSAIIAKARAHHVKTVF